MAFAVVCGVLSAREGSWMFAGACALMLLSAFVSFGLAMTRSKQNRLAA